MADTQTPTQKLTVALVCKGRGDASLNAAISLLKLQTALVRTSVQTEVHIVDELDDAIVIACNAGTSLFAFETNIGFDVNFPLTALASDKDVVVAPYPLPSVDWARVANSPVSQEPVQFRGNTYSATPAALEHPSTDGYVRALTARLGCVFIRHGVAADIRSRHPEVVHATGAKYAFVSVDGGVLQEAHETFARLYAKPIWIDLAHPSDLNGPMPFAGSVGMRAVLR